jgi:60 kDa SS-A/Ro ribonucleoprotein
MKTNSRAVNTNRTHEGGMAAIKISPEKQLERLVATCMLFENTFYEKGSSAAQAIAEASKAVSVEFLSTMAMRARSEFKLRHVPLWLLVLLNERRAECQPRFVADTIASTIQRPDEMGEFLSLTSKRNGDGDIKKILTAQAKKGLAKAFSKFSEYQIAKWNRDSAIKLRDVLFLCHAKPVDDSQKAVFKALIDGTLAPPDTWEVALSGGADKKETFERLLSDNKLGYIALLMNLRNMDEAGVDPDLVDRALVSKASGSRALPFRFVAAAKHAPAHIDALDQALGLALSDEEPLKGTTHLLVDVSGSMIDKLSGKGDTARIDAAAGLAALLRGICQRIRIWTFSGDVMEIPTYRGLALAEYITNDIRWTGTYLRRAMGSLPGGADRVVVITDEQTHDGIGEIKANRGYVINVAPYSPGLGINGNAVRINGWSERVVDMIRYLEDEKLY